MMEKGKKQRRTEIDREKIRGYVSLVGIRIEFMSCCTFSRDPRDLECTNYVKSTKPAYEIFRKTDVGTKSAKRGKIPGVLNFSISTSVSHYVECWKDC